MSILTGRSVKYCAGLIAASWNKHGWHNGHGSWRQVKGVWSSDIYMALGKMGFQMIGLHSHRESFHGKTLRQWMRGRGGPNWKETLLVQLTSHFVVVHRDQVLDNRAEAHYSEHHSGRCRVDQIWRIRPKKR